MFKLHANSWADFLLGVLFLQKNAKSVNAEEHALLAPYFREKTLNVARICENCIPFGYTSV